MRKFALALLVLFGVFIFTFINLRSPQLASAATANTINFQARLQAKTGGIVPDGNYNIEFKLYSASSGGSALWTEDYLNSASQGLQTINGYLSTNLGSLTSFPSTINWDQQLWLTMNIGGTTTGSVTWDGEMNPRIALTALPYALSAGQLQTTSGSNTSKLNLQAPTGGSQTFQVQDQGAAGTYNLLAQNASTGVVTLGTPSSLTGKLNFANSGSANTVTLTTAAETVGNATITIPDTAGVNDTVCLQTKANCGSSLTVGNLDGGTPNSKGATLTSSNLFLQSATGSVPGLVNITAQTFAGDKTFTGSTVFNPATPSLTAFQIQNSGGTIFDVDTTNGRVGINTTAPNYALEVNGDINSTTNVRVGGVAVCVVTGCTPATGSSNYIQNSTSTQTGANINIRSAATNAITEVVQGASGQTADIFQIQSWNGTSTTLLAGVSSAGTFTVGSSSQYTIDSSGNFSGKGTGTIAATSTAAFSVQNATNVSYFNVDTSTGTITLGNASSGNYVTFTASGGLAAFGTAQHAKSIVLTPEYAGAVLDISGDSTCTSATNGTMTAGYDNVNFQNYYKWVSNATAQCYDVVVRVPIPSDWGSWSSTTPLSITGYTNNTSTSTLNLQVINGSNSTETSCNYVNVTPGSTSTWSANTTGCTFASTTSGYSAGGVMTLRIRMSGGASSDVRLGNITLNYNSKY